MGLRKDPALGRSWARARSLSFSISHGSSAGSSGVLSPPTDLHPNTCLHASDTACPSGWLIQMDIRSLGPLVREGIRKERQGRREGGMEGEKKRKKENLDTMFGRGIVGKTMVNYGREHEREVEE